jgi:hypothetical protein
VDHTISPFLHDDNDLDHITPAQFNIDAFDLNIEDDLDPGINDNTELPYRRDDDDIDDYTEPAYLHDENDLLAG